MEIQKLTCTRCAYNWYPRQPVPPRTCPNCRSQYWNRQKVRTFITDARQDVRPRNKTKAD